VRVALIVAAVLVLVLVVSGVVLSVIYRPSARFPASPSLNHRQTAVSFWRGIHRIGAWLLLADAFVLLCAATMLAPVRRRAWLITLAAIGLPLTLTGLITGLRLPWTQLSLVAVTVGSDMRGYSPTWSSKVKYVLVGDDEVSRGTFRATFWFHALAVPALLLATFVAIVLVLRRKSADTP
jgi:quinol-cytochrome oxidoreductase complex cytochrome b subunit